MARFVGTTGDDFSVEFDGQYPRRGGGIGLGLETCRFHDHQATAGL